MYQQEGSGKDTNHEFGYWEGEAGSHCCTDPLRKQGGGQIGWRTVMWDSELW